MNPSSTPVGAILAYAGENPNQLAPGWLLCDGSQVTSNQFPELFAAIGTENGGAKQGPITRFNLPNMQGYFMRGLDITQRGLDPNVKDRQPANPGGNTGPQPATIQSYATCQPQSNPIPFRVLNMPVAQIPGNKGSSAGDPAATWATTQAQVVSGGDSESRPVNKYVHFIIKANSQIQGVDVPVPVGAVVPYSGPFHKPPSAGYILCDGEVLDVSRWPALFAAIGTAHGGDGVHHFYRPDFRGYFLRGVSGRSENDPNAASRESARQDLDRGQQGNRGNNVGSSQNFATGLPRNPTYVSNITCAGSVLEDNIIGTDACKPSSAISTAKSERETGDLETRPLNINVDWYIKAA